MITDETIKLDNYSDSNRICLLYGMYTTYRHYRERDLATDYGTCFNDSDANGYDFDTDSDTNPSFG